MFKRAHISGVVATGLILKNPYIYVEKKFMVFIVICTKTLASPFCNIFVFIRVMRQLVAVILV